MPPSRYRQFMNWAFDNSTKLVALLSLALIIVTTVHDWAYFLVIGSKFRSIQTTYDYITSAIEWLPTFLLGMIVSFLASLLFRKFLGRRTEFGFADQRQIYWTRRIRFLVIFIFLPVLAALLSAGLYRPFPDYVLNLVAFVATVFIGGLMLSRPWLSDPIRAMIPFILLTSGLLTSVFIAGITDGSSATRTLTDVHRISLKGGEIRYASVLRTFEKGVLTWNPANESVQFIRWEQIDELSHQKKEEREAIGCRLLGWFCKERFEP